MGKETKIEKYINPDEVPAFLRSLADAIENGAEGENAYLSVLEGFERLKLSVKNEFGQTCVKIKAKPPKIHKDALESPEGEGEDGQAETKPSYKKLKKRMKSSFKMIFKMVHDGNLPPAEAVEQFIADSRLMITYPGYGDEYYEEYGNAVDEFEKIFAEGNVEQIHEACDKLNSIKAHCHAKYD